MKSIVYVVFCCLFCVLTISSCNKKSKTESSVKRSDTIWNEKIQDTFFDATFGDDITDVVEKFKKHGFFYFDNISTDALLHFLPKQGRYFTFGNMGWEILDVYAQNGKFVGISFMNTSDDKASALSTYNGIKNSVEAKYKASSVEFTDTTIYEACNMFGRNDVGASVQCFRYETINREIKIGIRLVYGTTKSYDVSDEL